MSGISKGATILHRVATSICDHLTPVPWIPVALLDRMETSRFSAYYRKLDNTAKEWYEEKLGRIGLRDDPYVLED